VLLADGREGIRAAIVRAPVAFALGAPGALLPSTA